MTKIVIKTLLLKNIGVHKLSPKAKGWGKQFVCPPLTTPKILSNTVCYVLIINQRELYKNYSTKMFLDVTYLCFSTLASPSKHLFSMLQEGSVLWSIFP